LSAAVDSPINPTVRDHFLNPRNVGQIVDASGIGEARDLSLGAFMRFSIQVEHGVIRQARFKTMGCSTAIAASSVTTELLTSKTPEEAEALKPEDVVRALEGLPAEKWCYPEMACRAVRAAIEDFRRRH